MQLERNTDESAERKDTQEDTEYCRQSPTNKARWPENQDGRTEPSYNGKKKDSGKANLQGSKKV